MCKCINVDFGDHSNTVLHPIPNHMKFYEEARVKAGLTPFISFDACLEDEILELWSKGIETMNSCCGHNKFRGSIIVSEKSIDKMIDLEYERDFDHYDREDIFFAKSV